MVQRRESVQAEGEFGDWTPITVHLNGDISARNRTRPYKGAMFAAHPGDIVFSKIDARNGAIGMFPPEIGKAVVTSEFPVFTPDPALLEGEFVRLVLRTGGFIEDLRQRASGTSGRKRITLKAFQDLRIPVPPLYDQRRIVATYRASLNRATKLEHEADEIETRAMTAFEAALGLEPPSPLPHRPVFAAYFKDLDRWSHETVLRGIAESEASKNSHYPIVRLGEVIADLENGWSPKCHDRPASDSEWGVLKVSAASSGKYQETENKALPRKLKPRSSLEVQIGDVLLTRASGVARLVGVAVVVENTRNRLMICDKIFRIVDLDNARTDVRFLAYALGIHSVRTQIEREVSTRSGMMKNISKPALLALSFPLPSKNEQAIMVDALNDARVEAAESRRHAEEMRAKAWTEFESAVYPSKNDAPNGSFQPTVAPVPQS